MFAYPHPLLNLNAGRVKNDPLNEQRIKQVLASYQKHSGTNN